MSNFKVGDVVVCIDDACTGGFLKKGREYTITKVHDNTDVAVDGICHDFGWIALRFELRKESKMQQSTEQKTKIIDPSCVEDWHKAVGMYFGGVKVKEFKYVATEYEVAVCFISNFSDDTFNGVFYKGGFDKGIKLEVPITTKRIPFNPELKDVKAFYKETELIEWVQMKSGVVCGIIRHEDGGYTTSLYHPNILEMEVEE